MYMSGHNDLDSHTSGYFTLIVSKSGYNPSSFLGVSVEETFSRGTCTILYTISISKKENVQDNYLDEVLEDLTKQSNY